jgi:hypothetical protein
MNYGVQSNVAELLGQAYDKACRCIVKFVWHLAFQHSETSAHNKTTCLCVGTIGFAGIEATGLGK